MENVLYTKIATGALITCFRPDQDYSEMADLAAAAVVQTEGEGQTIVGYAIARGSDVTEHMSTYALTVSDFSVCAKSAVPGGNKIFTPYGVTVGDIPDEQLVLYGTQP